MGELLETYLAAMRPVLLTVPFPLPTEKPLAISSGLGGLSKHRSSFCAIKQKSVSKLEEVLAGRLIAHTSGPVIQDAGSATASCVIPALGWTASCRLSFSACSITAETAGLHLAVDLLAENSPTCSVAVACDSRAALLVIVKPEQIDFGTQLVITKLNVLLATGADVSLNWVRSQLGVHGNKQTGALTKEAHHSATYVCRAAVASHFSRPTLRRLFLLCHPDYCVATVEPQTRLPDRGITKRNGSLLLQLCFGYSEPAARRHLLGKAWPPACTSCGADETIEHLLCVCSAPRTQRDVLLAALHRHGLPWLHRDTSSSLYGTTPRSSLP
ncbi:hypothetical protein HPB51_023066 [Rhipicephalus microplus]|uniref:Tick transposon n=1 Tax=Rhipicephalus microplus TaxID=6941 RepID=A0A9J6ECK8_RHIMP|nr:hypothetical protein HPB51_023066 [Rhipicephalus microplus]